MKVKNLLLSIVTIFAVTGALAAKGGARARDLVTENNKAVKAAGGDSLVKDLASLRQKGGKVAERTQKVTSILSALKASKAATAVAEAFIVYHPSMTDSAIKAATGESKEAYELMYEVRRDLEGETRFNTNESNVAMQTIGSVLEILTNGTANEQQIAFSRDLIVALKKQVSPDLPAALKEAGGKYALENKKNIDEWLDLLCKCTGRCIG